jgi:Patched family
LKIASNDLYYIDEGTFFGVVDTNLLIGGATPPVKDANSTNPLQKASVLQTIYPASKPPGIRERVANCHRPGGAINITTEEAEQVLFEWKKKMESQWSEGWNDDSTEIQFVAFADDSGVTGSTGRMLREITLNNTVLTIISIIAIAVFSVFFMFSTNMVESRVVVTLVGVALVVLSYFAAVGVGLLVGIKIQVPIAWTLPFIILGLGVDDMYIVLHTLRQQGGYSEGYVRSLCNRTSH